MKITYIIDMKIVGQYTSVCVNGLCRYISDLCSIFENWHLSSSLQPQGQPQDSKHYCVGEALPSLNVWGYKCYKCLSQLLQEQPPPLFRHPSRAHLTPYHIRHRMRTYQ